MLHSRHQQDHGACCVCGPNRTLCVQPRTAPLAPSTVFLVPRAEYLALRAEHLGRRTLRLTQKSDFYNASGLRLESALLDQYLKPNRYRLAYFVAGPCGMARVPAETCGLFLSAWLPVKWLLSLSSGTSSPRYAMRQKT
jgi:hypothetical protein